MEQQVTTVGGVELSLNRYGTIRMMQTKMTANNTKPRPENKICSQRVLRSTLEKTLDRNIVSQFS